MAEVARAAGVGMGTVSRVLNNAPGVSQATRRRVLEAAEALAYVVSPEASGLRSGAKGRVAVVVPHLSRWFFAAMLEGVEAELRHAGLDVLLYCVRGVEEREAFFRLLPARRKVDAVVVLAFPVNDAEAERLELLGVQIVAAGGQVAAYPYVSIDDGDAARKAVDHLIHLGHRRIGMIAAMDPDDPHWPPDPGRSEGYRRALEAAGLSMDQDLVRTVDWGGVEGADAMGQLLALPHPPTAVYAHSDEVALGAIRTIRRLGLRVPEDISVIGIDDHPLAELADLTTIRQPVTEQGRKAGRLVCALLNGEDPERSVMLPTELVVRRSTAAIRTPSDA